MRHSHFLVSILLFLLCFSSNQRLNAGNKTQKIVFVGASITYGALIENREQNSYPAQLQKLLGSKFQVFNLGVSSCTMLRRGDYSYWDRPEFQQALSLQPDIVFIDLGGNDSKLINRTHLNEFEQDCRDMVLKFRELPSKPRVILLLPVVSFVQDTTGIWDPVIVNSVIPHTQQVAYEQGVEVINLHSLLINRPELFPDKIHPNKEGATLTAQKIYKYLVQKTDRQFDAFKKLPASAQISSFHGYPCADFIFEGRDCKVVKPKHAAIGQPWIWRARFWGHEPQTEIALLERGFHVVYCDVAEMFGNKEAITIWNHFYALLQQTGLSHKGVLEGMSRGGIYALNWAAENKDKVACVYIDNPLLDLKTWPAGLGRHPVSKDEFEEFKKDYNLKTPEDIANFKGSPMDKVDKIAGGKYNILILSADDDSVLSPEENALLFEKKMKTLNGKVTVIHKPGYDHHPHSLPNPDPIVNFILTSTGYQVPVPEK
ncbi:MAG: GDSL-type esterase/lipase family protein [Bacteroidota bacterium]|nr:GDSL-type esterase/lipase family protein [Bacteroidota bacterium]